MSEATSSRKSEGKNLRVSSRAWELIRWAKFKKESKSYSVVIEDMFEEIDNRDKKLKRYLQTFDKTLHQITSSREKSSKPKTILLNPSAHKKLDQIKLETNDPDFTFSDAIEFLVSENNLIPDHLK